MTVSYARKGLFLKKSLILACLNYNLILTFISLPCNTPKIVDCDTFESQMEFPTELINDSRIKLRYKLLNLLIAEVPATGAQPVNLNNGYTIAAENQNQNDPVLSLKGHRSILTEIINGTRKLGETKGGPSTLKI
ncbi:hypothetical protein Pint_19015 [Pistacia integerrima]|uniref:Uncharacterized protein n=1 Tax=Pistacia integerrima TaxID=434235 RepID=A0ACC0YYT6_9ROSI|nr:hypothetical protein Pint_19015 [Pistacia integerrima]